MITYLNSDIQKNYLENHAKLLLPDTKHRQEDSMDDRIAYASTVAADIVSAGFAISRKDVERLAECSTSDIVSFYRVTMPVLERSLGKSYKGHTFYPNFPDEVMEKDRISIFLDQVLYCITGFELKPEVYEKTRKAFPFMGKEHFRPLHLADMGEYRRDIADTCRSAAAFSKGQIKEIRAFMMSADEKDTELFPDETHVKQKENKIILGLLWKFTEHENRYALLDRYIKTPEDVLRFAAAQSAKRDLKRSGRRDSDTSMERVLQMASFQYDRDSMPSFGLCRADRRYVMEKLEEFSIDKYGKHRAEMLASHMFCHRREWKRLINQIHINEMQKNGCYAMAEAAEMLHKNISVDRYEKRVETAIQNNDLKTAVKELSGHPGNFIRCFDKLLRMSMLTGETDSLLKSLEDAAKYSGIGPVISLCSRISARDKNETERYFKGKSGKIWKTDKKNRTAIPAPVRGAVRTVCFKGMTEKFRGKGSMGKIYISPEIKDYTAPLKVRTLNQGVNVDTIGTVKPIEYTKDTLRMFVGWNDTDDDRVDIDLTCELIDQSGKWIHVGWDGAYMAVPIPGTSIPSSKIPSMRMAVVYSGDVQSGQGSTEGNESGAIDCGCEYVDLDTAVLKNKGYQYAVIGISIYIGAKSFADIPHCTFGYMERNRKDEGELFEVKSIVTRQELKTEGRMYVPMILDLANDRIIFSGTDVACIKEKKNSVMSQNLDEVRKLLPIVSMEADDSFTIDDLVRINAEGNRGKIVDDAMDADILFITAEEQQALLKENGEGCLDDKEVHLPTDYTYYTGVLLADPVRGKDLFCRKTESTTHD